MVMKFSFNQLLMFLIPIFLFGCSSSGTVRPVVDYKPITTPTLPGNNQEYELIKMEELRLPKYLYERGIEGYVIVQFSIDENGKTFNHKILESDQGHIFGPIAIEHISRYQYKPRIVNGVKVSLDGVKQKISSCFSQLNKKPDFIFGNKSKECANN
jgi:TonB family protein